MAASRRSGLLVNLPIRRLPRGVLRYNYFHVSCMYNIVVWLYLRHALGASLEKLGKDLMTEIDSISKQPAWPPGVGGS